MLNISPVSIKPKVQADRFKSFQKTDLSNANAMFSRFLIGTLLIFLVFMFLPWTQNIQSKGKVTTLRPEQRPQTIQSTIAGRIEKWYVREGELVEKGDTLIHLSEIKSEYFDPQLVGRTKSQVEAKMGSVASYKEKVKALETQIQALKDERKLKLEQLRNKIRQAQFKIAADSIELQRAKVANTIADTQLVRVRRLYKEVGTRSRQDYENQQNKKQDAVAKQIQAENKLLASRNELLNTRLAYEEAIFTYAEKLAKAESERQATLSNMYEGMSQVNKMEIDLSNYEQRSSFYYITAPQDGYVTEALSKGLGETVKEQESIVTLMPADYELAVEMYIKPMDLPLMALGQEVRFLFDGWPAIVFSGWPGFSFGTFKGEVVAIDNIIQPDGTYRILVGPDPDGEPWPQALRPGSGANGIALLNTVQLWYELWRKLNGFPPEYYDGPTPADDEPKLKAPVKAIK